LRNIVREIDLLLKRGAPRYNLWNLPHEDYTPDIVEHWLRYWFPHLRRVHEVGPSTEFETDLLAIYLDLTGAVAELPAPERRVMNALLEGYNVYGDESIASRLGPTWQDRQVKDLLRSGYRRISDKLNPSADQRRSVEPQEGPS
jgi:hypothetical protein